MTIDERLDRLTERHEALTQSVEMLVHAQRRNEDLLTRVIGVVESIAQMVRSHDRRITDLEGGRA